MTNRENVVARLKEVVAYYEKTLDELPQGKFDVDMRMMIKKLNNDTFEEIKELIKRL